MPDSHATTWRSFQRGAACADGIRALGQLDWTSLRPGVIHGDANDHNVLASAGRMTGLLDFGDMVHSAIVCDLAVALAYAMLGERDPLAAAGAVIRGYHRHNPLNRSEQLALDVLVRARLAASLCYAAHNKIREPDDPYQVVSEAGVRGSSSGSTRIRAARRRRWCGVRESTRLAGPRARVFSRRRPNRCL